MARLLWVCLGGAAGSGARYLVAGWAQGLTAGSFPLGTLAVNVLGSFLLGGLMHVGIATEWMSPAARLALTTGAMGGFTTFSTFSYETVQLLEEGAAVLAAANVAGTLVVCLAACFAGAAVGRALAGG